MIKKVKRLVPGVIKFSYGLLDSKSRRKLWFSGVVLSLVAFLDLIAIALIAIVASITLNSVNNNKLSSSVSSFLNFFHIENLSVYTVVGILIFVMVILFVFRTIFSLYYSNKVYYFLANQSNIITKKTLIKLLNQDMRNIRKLPTQEIVFGLTNGLNAAVVNLNGLIISTFAEIFLSIIMIITLVLFSPIASLVSLLFIGIFMKLLYAIFNQKILELSVINTSSSITSYKKILEVLETYPESVVRDTRENYIEEITNLRSNVSRSIAAQSVLPNISKYTMELSLIIGGVFVSSIMFLLFDGVKALTGLALFIAVGSRISPAFLRIQQNFLSYRMNEVQANTAKKLIDMINPTYINSNGDLKVEPFSNFDPYIRVKELKFKYELEKDFSLEDINLTIPAGSFTAIVGKSGSGKTTLVDLILGLLVPDMGSIVISGESPLSVHRRWPGVVAYVPQDVIIVDDTFAKNITLGFDIQSTDRNQILKCIKLSHLSSVVEALPNKLEETLGEKGSKLSGGQRQRVGIARALYTDPQILVLDEATSALDGESEKEINSSMQELKGEITIVMIAHRLSSVVNADQIIYMENGKIVARGSFEEVRKLSQNFNNQAILMGL
jgi:ABC-type multidrug transport system fused ATPase/permease subunit